MIRVPAEPAGRFPEVMPAEVPPVGDEAPPWPDERRLPGREPQ
ncbi:hypothetical protein [Streptomyces sp. AC555_RSS877]|nr:hypothetical protein [Streptomyces sp. AC555_RSS877]